MKIKYILFIITLSATFLYSGSVVSATGLTPYQVGTIVDMLKVFGADNITINNVQTTLNGKTTTQPSITIISPNGGETLQIEKNNIIRWKSSNVENVNIYLEKWGDTSGNFSGGPLTWLIGQNINSKNGSYSWTIPSSITPSITSGTLYKINIEQIGNNVTVSDRSDNYFRIVPSSVSCKAGQKIGDIDGNGVIDDIDYSLIENMVSGFIPVPENKCCVDIDNDGKISINDWVKIGRIIKNLDPSPGACPTIVSCKFRQKIGDIDGNGIIDKVDYDLAGNIIAGLIDAPENKCCIDMDKDGKLLVNDWVKIGRIANGLDKSPGVCSMSVSCKPGQRIGDADGNGTIDKIDYDLVGRVYSKTISMPENICCIDVDKNGSITATDWTKVSRIINGLDKSPGVCPNLNATPAGASILDAFINIINGFFKK